MEVLTTELGICDLETYVKLEWRSNRLLHEILYAHQIHGDRVARRVNQGVPASKSSFSRPYIFVAKTTSPVPIAPYLPFRKTRARAVSGLWPFSSRLRSGCCFLTTSRGPTGTSARDLDGSALGLLDAADLGGIVYANSRGKDVDREQDSRAKLRPAYSVPERKACASKGKWRINAAFAMCFEIFSPLSRILPAPPSLPSHPAQHAPTCPITVADDPPSPRALAVPNWSPSGQSI